MIFKLAESFYNIMPKFMRKKQGKQLFTAKSKEEWKKRSQDSQQRDQPFDWVCEYVDGGDNEDFAYGMNMMQCGNVDLWKKYGIEQYTPYLCLVDWPGWKASEIEASRTQTLAHGASYCDFRYIKIGQNCPRGWPPESMEEWQDIS